MIIDDLGFSFREVVEAENGVQALAIYEKHKPDIIIVDIQMPHMDGIEFLKKIRDIGADSRVIIFSGYSEFEYARKLFVLRLPSICSNRSRDRIWRLP